jgi:hypothetical protein
MASSNSVRTTSSSASLQAEPQGTCIGEIVVAGRKKAIYIETTGDLSQSQYETCLAHIELIARAHRELFTSEKTVTITKGGLARQEERVRPLDRHLLTSHFNSVLLRILN